MLALMLVLVAGDRSVRGAEGVNRQGADETFEAALTALGAKCDELGLQEQGRVSRRWFIPRDPRRAYLFFPLEVDLAEPADDAPRLLQYWHAKFMELREQQAERLFKLARQAADSGDEAMAYRLLHEVLHEDPEHAQALRILGYRRGQRERRPSSRRVSGRSEPGPHRLLGWTRDECWRIESQHFRVTTNCPPNVGREVTRYLERVHAVWRQLFYPYWSVSGRLVARFQGEDRALGPVPTFSVVLFRNREDYVRELGTAEPRIEMSVGYYSHTHEIAFFHAGNESGRTTWVHESAHQFFQEQGMVDSRVGERRNFWVVEGLALYMESLRDHGTYATTGGADAERLQFARFRKLSQHDYVPLAELIQYGQEQMQQASAIRKLYSHSAGLTHFLIHGDQGRSMRPFMDYVKAVYRGVAGPETLKRKMEVPLAELDQGYQEYLNVTDADLRFVNPNARSLCLAHSEVTDAGLGRLSPLEELRWLDLSFTGVSDAGLAPFAESRELEQLNLEKTRITDAALDMVARFRNLKELDLSRTAVTDEGVRKLSGLSRLKVLWLTGTRITDEGLSALTSLRNLERLDVQSSRVTSAALDQLRQRLPRLKE
ncbi:MAG: leucine-rich repeat domain-containing protein [Planctomycetota bacterium]